MISASAVTILRFDRYSFSRRRFARCKVGMAAQGLTLLAFLTLLSSIQAEEPERMFGAILPAEKVDLGTRKEGTIASISVDAGDSIEIGQMLVSMDRRELEARASLCRSEWEKSLAISQDPSAILAARAQLARSEATWKSHQSLKQKSDLEMFRLEMDLRERQAAFELAQARQRQDAMDAQIKEGLMKLAELDLDACQIMSPIHGTVAEKLKHAGEYVRPGEPILKIVRMDQLAFRVELSMRQVPPDQLADFHALLEIHLDDEVVASLKDVAFDRILPSNIDDEHYYAIATITNSQVKDRVGKLHWKLRPGMVGEVRLEPIPRSSSRSGEPKWTSFHP